MHSPNTVPLEISNMAPQATVAVVTDQTEAACFKCTDLHLKCPKILGITEGVYSRSPYSLLWLAKRGKGRRRGRQQKWGIAASSALAGWWMDTTLHNNCGLQ